MYEPDFAVKPWRRAIKLMAATGLAMTPGYALPQNEPILEEVVVTATRREARQLDVAIPMTAMYDAWTCYNDSGCEVSTTTGSRLKQADAYCSSKNREKAYSHGAYTAAHALFHCALPPEHKNMFRDFMCDCGYNPDDKNLEPDNAAGVGNLSGLLVLECRLGDASFMQITFTSAGRSR